MFEILHLPMIHNFFYPICSVFLGFHGSYRLEKYLNSEGFLKKSLKIKSVLKVLENHSKALKIP